MRLIVCVDDDGGMSFFGRRQSKDRALRARILELTEGSVLWMNGYSAGQFEEIADNIRVDEDFLEKAGAEDWCFVETQRLEKYADRICSLVIYRWNRKYPSDQKLPGNVIGVCPNLVSTGEFAGFSHEVIHEEVYSR